MKITQTSQNFYGYKNIISDEISSRNGMMTFFAAQLNDEGHPDLSEFKKLKRLLKQSEDLINNDVFCATYTHSQGNKPNLFIGNQVLFWGNELRWLKDNRPKAMPLKDYKEMETTHLKAYTLLANLTKRITNEKYNNKDSGLFLTNLTKQIMHEGFNYIDFGKLLAYITDLISHEHLDNTNTEIKNVIFEALRVMSNFTQDEKAAFEVIRHAFETKIPFQITAAKFNQTCTNTMAKFLR